jgi:ATP-dependent phosphofructokinase / diphosphate-dependent phosphofructokinase
LRVALLTGGGDCPGLNAAIRAVARSCFSMDWTVLGIRNGWAGLLGDGQIEELNRRSVSGILHLGGTILGTSRTNPMKREDHMQQVTDNLKRHEIDALVAIGGDDTLSVAARLYKDGHKVVGVPKTMDNDLCETDYCIGFDSAVQVVMEALDRLHTTASAHHRVLVVEVMGRDAGWVAVEGGLAGGADLILIPEVPADIDRVCRHLERRRAAGKDFSIIVVAEGVRMPELATNENLAEVDAFGHVRLDKRGVGENLARQIERKTGFETRVTVLGHLQRGGSPSVTDRVNGTRFGVAAVELIKQGQFGYLPALKGNRIVPVKLSDAVARTKTVDIELYKLAELFY